MVIRFAWLTWATELCVIKSLKKGLTCKRKGIKPSLHFRLHVEVIDKSDLSTSAWATLWILTNKAVREWHDQQNSISVSFNKKSLCTPEFLSDPGKKGWTKVDLGVEHVRHRFYCRSIIHEGLSIRCTWWRERGSLTQGARTTPSSRGSCSGPRRTPLDRPYGRPHRWKKESWIIYAWSESQNDSLSSSFFSLSGQIWPE